MRYYLQDLWITFSHYLELCTSRLTYEYDKNPLAVKVAAALAGIVILAAGWMLVSHAVNRPSPQEAAVSAVHSTQPSSQHRVVRVVDGDTLVVSIEGTQEATVRLIGVDTPETVKPNSPVQCFGKEATMHMKQLAQGKYVTLEPDTTQDDTDTYDRLLRYVFLEDGRNLALEMIKGGYGKEYTYAAAYNYQTSFQEAEQQAKDSSLGLWADCETQPKRPTGTPVPQTTRTTEPAAASAQPADCDPNYAPCIAHVTYDLDCGDIRTSVRVIGYDTHGFDRDGDGAGCESY